ncbi:cyclic AMP-dependent transcription factor ATF-6 beta-like [Pollicipes pollicipes]|uniref:cyclic AMP-dependent transcription factor ATF-6 beta-like n=1 Tax=Pollicipes pollicipes TaxID=41117 RepID=UPI001885A3EE|nr:cyclic AMP-dependent transcription factor ATF-6 beta-like [Pollicipes pollicipes]
MMSRLLKRQERMIKNRMSACLSRKKKKDQFSEMENQQLHRRLAQLQVEVDMLRGLQTPASPPPSPRRPLLLLSVLLIASLNLAPISSLLSGPLPPPFDPSEGDRTAETAPGRTLLWAPADPPTEDTGDATNSSGGANCSPHVSQLEARRLSKVLRSWFERFHLPTAPGLDPVADRHGYPTFRTAGNTSGRPSRRERWQQAAHPAGRPAAFMEAWRHGLRSGTWT